MWLSPVDGAPLEHDTPHSLADGRTRWPVVDGIAYLRVGRDALRERALTALDAGDRTGALVALLADRGDWERGESADDESLRRLVDGIAIVSLREATSALAYGPAATEILYRWIDPAYLAGLALLAAHRPTHGRVLEVACGAGHSLRELARVGVETLGADLVFSKLWLARHFVAPTADYVCFDVRAPWPLREHAAHLVYCNDAFHYFAKKGHAIAEMRRVMGPSGTLLIGHAHTRSFEDAGAGEPLDPAMYEAVVDARTLYDDEELTRAMIEERAPHGVPCAMLDSVRAVSLVAGGGAGPPRAARADVTMPAVGTHVRRNPLYARDGDGRYRVRWPSDRYESEYKAVATYPLVLDDAPPEIVTGASLQTDRLVRSRAYVSLPARW